MRLVEGGLGPATAYIIIGDGRRERRILRGVVEKYNHRKALRIPDDPLPGRTGFKTCIERLTLLLDKTRVTTYLIIVDREHLEIQDPKNLEKELRKHGIEVIELQEVEKHCWRLELRRGAKRAALYIAVLGQRKRVEENLAQLIQLLYGEQVEGEKEAVDKWLKEHGIEDIDLVRKASRKIFEQAFPQLAKPLQELSHN